MTTRTWVLARRTAECSPGLHAERDLVRADPGADHPGSGWSTASIRKTADSPEIGTEPTVCSRSPTRATAATSFGLAVYALVHADGKLTDRATGSYGSGLTCRYDQAAVAVCTISTATVFALDATSGKVLWQLPGRSRGRARDPAGLADTMRQHGLPVRAARNTAMMQSLADLPPIVIADLFGIHPGTATGGPNSPATAGMTTWPTSHSHMALFVNSKFWRRKRGRAPSVTSSHARIDGRVGGGTAAGPVLA